MSTIQQLKNFIRHGKKPLLPGLLVPVVSSVMPPFLSNMSKNIRSLRTNNTYQASKLA